MPIDGIRRAFKRAGGASATNDVNDDLSFHVNRRVDELVTRGTLLGIAGALAVSRVLRGLVYGVGVTDPVTFGGRDGGAAGGGPGGELDSGAPGIAGRPDHRVAGRLTDGGRSRRLTALLAGRTAGSEVSRAMDPVKPQPPSPNVPGEPAPPPSADLGELALVMGGGGARGAYQVGFLRHLARRFPALRLPILTGVSAGAVNVAHLAQHTGTFTAAVASLERLWRSLSPDQVFRVDPPTLGANFLRWGTRLISGGKVAETQTKGLVDTAPLRMYLTRALTPHDGVLTGIEQNIARGSLRAVALSTTDYGTGQSIVWMQGRNIEEWERPKRRSIATRLTVDHVMGSAALPFFFPAVKIADSWHGDGGIRLTAPLSPALHLGAHKILAVSTRYDRSQAEANRPLIRGYPPPAQVLSVLYNAIFLDLIDQDVLRLEKMNWVLRKLPPSERAGMRVVNILVLRPSRDLGKLSSEYEPLLPGFFRFMTRGLGTRQTASPDILSLLMFQENYLGRLIELGEADADARAEEIQAFLEKD